MPAAPDVDLVVAAQGGDGAAFGTLFDRWFDRVYDVAWRIVRDRETAREVAQDVFLVAWQKLDTIEQPASFGGWLLRTSRNRALNRLERERRTVALGDEETMMEIDRRTDGGEAGDVTVAAAAAHESADLVWAAAQALGQRDASVLDLHLRHGLGPAELAEALEVTPNHAHQLLFRLKGRLEGAIRAWVLWGDGRPACADLARACAAADVVRFGPEAVRVASRHAARCTGCTGRQQTRLSPQAMFAAVPFVAVGSLVKGQAASALAAAGVPAGVPSPAAPALDGGPGPDGGAGGPEGVGGGSDAGAESMGQGGSAGGPDGVGGGPGGGSDAGGPGQGGGAGGPEDVDGGVGGGSDAAGPEGIGVGGSDATLHLDRGGEGPDATAPGDHDWLGRSGPAPGSPGATRRRRRVLAGIGVVVVGVVVLLVAVGPFGGDDRPEQVAVEVPRSTDPPLPSSTGPPPTLRLDTLPPTAPVTVAPVPPPSPAPQPTSSPPPPPTAPPTTAPEAPTTTRPTPPVINSFEATPDPSGDCPTASTAILLEWASTGGDTAALTGTGAPSGPLPPTGTARACAPVGAADPTYELVVTGPGGEARRTSTVVPPDPPVIIG